MSLILINIRDGKTIQIGETVHHIMVDIDGMTGQQFGERDDWFRVNSVDLRDDHAILSITNAYVTSQAIVAPVKRQGNNIIVLVPD